jgi:hypothetical protein
MGFSPRARGTLDDLSHPAKGEYHHSSIINGYDKGPKTHPWRFINHRLQRLAGAPFHHTPYVSGLERTTPGPHPGIPDPIAAPRHMDRVSCRPTANGYPGPHANVRDSDLHLSFPGL